MSISTKELKDANKLVISIKERFDFSVHQKFRDSYISADTKKTEFVLDLALTTYMDSSALGMILLLKDHAESLKGSIIIKSPSETVNKILEIAQFHRLLTIEK